VSKLPDLRPWNGLEGWGQTIIGFGQWKNEKFVRVWHDNSRYGDWVLRNAEEKKNEIRKGIVKPTDVHFLRFAAYLKENKRLARKEKLEIQEEAREREKAKQEEQDGV
jgi:hypothetical protein